MPELGILSLAMMVTLLSGGLDLSIIATANLCALTMGFVLTHHPVLAGIGWLGWQVLAIATGAAVAAVIGLLNGCVVAYVGVSPILATLGTMTMVRGIAIGLTHGNVISGFPPGSCSSATARFSASRPRCSCSPPWQFRLPSCSAARRSGSPSR